MNGSPPAYFFTKFVAAEVVDPNLSVVDIGITNEVTGTSQLHFIPKLASVTGMVAGDILLCSSNPVVILGIVQGDITLAS